MASSCARGVSGQILGKQTFSGVVMHWHRPPRNVVESLSLEVFGKRGTEGHGLEGNIGGKWMIGLDDLGVPFQPQLPHSMRILRF